jgi:hypothetical protein
MGSVLPAFVCAPSKAELAEIIRPGDNVFLCTDVISTGSLLKELVRLIRRLDAKIIGVVALVDAREESSESWNAVFEPEVSGIPLFLSASLNRRVVGSNLERVPEYWVDPVSAVPSTYEPETTIDQGKVVRSVDLLCKTGAVTVGHYVTGLRHTSVRINIQRLFLERSEIYRLTEIEFSRLMQQPDWTHFSPSLALVPAGIDRIDRVDGSVQPDKAASEMYADIVSELFSGRLNIFLVPRSFEPGQVKCANIDYIAKYSDVTDVIIVDDGISSGGTVSLGLLVQNHLRHLVQ